MSLQCVDYDAVIIHKGLPIVNQMQYYKLLYS